MEIRKSRKIDAFKMKPNPNPFRIDKKHADGI